MGKVRERKSLGEREALFGSLERPIADEPTRDPGMPQAGPVPRGTLIGDEPKCCVFASEPAGFHQDRILVTKCSGSRVMPSADFPTAFASGG